MKKRSVAVLLTAVCILASFGCQKEETKDRGLSLRSLNMSEYVTLGEYKGLTATKEKVTVTDEEVRENIDIIVENYIDELGVKDRPVEKGDKILCDLRCYVDDIAVLSEDNEGEVFVVGEGEILSEVEEGVVGMLPGESKKIKMSFDKDYASEELAGKDAVLLIKVNAIFPDKLTDDMIGKMSNTMYSNVEQLEQYIRNGLESTRQTQAEQNAQYALLTQVTDNSTVNALPDEYMEDQIQKIIDKYEFQSGLSGMSVEEYVSNVYGLSVEELADNYLKQRVVIEAIAQKEGIGYTDDSYEEEIEKRAKNQGITVEYYFLLNNLEDSEDYIEQLTFENVMSLVTDNAVID